MEQPVPEEITERARKIITDHEWMMSNFLPAKDEQPHQTRERRLVELIQTALMEAENKGIERSLETVKIRKDLYETKKARHDPTADDTCTEYEKVVHAQEGLDWLTSEMVKLKHPLEED